MLKMLHSKRAAYAPATCTAEAHVRSARSLSYAPDACIAVECSRAPLLSHAGPRAPLRRDECCAASRSRPTPRAIVPPMADRWIWGMTTRQRGCAGGSHMASSGSLPLYEMRRTWALVDLLTSLKRRANHPPPTAELIRRKFDTLPMPALDTLSILVDQTIAEQHGRLGQSMVCGMARAVRSFPEATAAEVAYAHACGQVVSDATIEAARVQTSHLLRFGFEHLALARQRGIPLCPIATDRHTHALDTLAKDRANNRRAALDLLGVDDADIPEGGGFVSPKGLLIGAASCIAVIDRLDRAGDICCGSCYRRVVTVDELSICRRCGDQLLCRECLAGLGSHATECKRVRAMVRSAAENLVPRLRESARQVAVVRLNGSGLIVPVHITSLASALVPSSLAEALSRCPAEMNLPAVMVYWRLLVAFLAKLEGDDQEVIDHEAVYHVTAAECAEAETPPTPRRPPCLLPSERRRLQKEAKAAEKRAKEEACAAAEAAAIAEANAVLERQSARPDATSAMLTSVLLKRGGTASPEVVARTRAKRNSLKGAEMRARKPAKAKPEEPNAAEQVRVNRDLTNGRLDATLLLQRRARTWLRGRKKLRRKLRSRTAKRIQSSVRTWLRLRVVAKPCIASGSEGADGEEPEPPKPEPSKLEAPDRHEPELPNKPASTEPANTECAICLDDNAEYAAVPCGHRCLCANCSKTISQCPVCRTKLSAVLRVFV